MRQPVSAERKFVEATAAGLAPDVTVHGRDAMFLQGQAVVERLAHGLHGEQVSGVTDGEALSIDRADTDAELVRIDPLELRNVVGDRTPVVGADTVGHLVKLAFEQGEVCNDEIAAQGPGDQPPAGLADGGELLDGEPATVMAVGVR